ncbi:striated muscle preferentially expressed protein kinase-like, partial [Salvelinus fontinalis]|uniref:striated muscle preferentially expressed protein kinase-like n=1 Tax=Salvelinus fontinalis TaxID=8038 RepID=UPI002486B524
FRSQSENVLRESSPQVLPPPSPRIIKCPSTSPMPSCSGSAPNTPLTPCKKHFVPTDYQDTVPAEFEEMLRHPKLSAMSQSSTQNSRPQTPVSVNEYFHKEYQPRPSPKLTRASSKIFEKVRGFEEARRSYDHEGSISGRSWAGFNHAGSVDSDDGGNRLGVSRESLREDLRESLKEDAAERRSNFRQKAASLEDCRPCTTQKFQEIENKFTEELQQIKKLVGKPHMKKSFSTEQLSLRARGRQPLRKIEPLPPQILQKLQERERAHQEKEQKETEQPKKVAPPRLHLQAQQGQPSPQTHEIEGPSMSNITVSRLGEVAATPESMQLADLWGQTPTRQENRVSPIKEILQRSPSPVVQRVSHMQESQDIQESPAQNSPKEESSGRKTPVEVALRKVEYKPKSPLVQRKPTVVQDHPIQPLQKPPWLVTSSTNIPLSPSEEKLEVELIKPAPKVIIPTIIVKEEPMEEEVPPETDKSKEVTNVKEGQTQKTRGKGRCAWPMSPELDSSDDSYVSAEEDPLEAPMFEFPLKDTVATAGTEVLLRVIIAGTPLPEVTWRRDNIEITNSPNYGVKVEGERYSLLIKCAKPSDAGTYCVTAANEAGRASSSATLSVKPEPMQEPQGNLGVPRDISSPITSDEEYLSPLEEGMDFGGPETRKIVDTRFKEPPAFQVTMNDQAVIEGQEVTMSVRLNGQPKPMVYWLRDRETIKTDLHHKVRETKDCTFEMTINSAQKSDTGVYTCKIINEYGTKQCECRLEVKVPPVEPGLTIIRPVMDITADAGETVMLECHIIGPLETDVDWLADGKLIQPALLNCKMHFDGKRCRLLLNSVHEDNSGSYTCKLTSPKEELNLSGQLKVIPSIKPLFTRKLDALEVIEGRNARFDCRVSGTPPPKVSWGHFDHTLVESDNVQILQEGGRHSLIISHVTNEDEGFYTVIACNPHGDAESSAELYVQEPKPAMSSQMAKLEKMPSIPEEPELLVNEVERFTMPDFVKPLYDLDVIEGTEAVLKCKVAGLPYPTIVWFHNGKKIDSMEDRKLTQFRDIHSLVISCVCHAHGGVYKSVISNKVGKATCYAQLYVTDVLPEPPDGPPVIEAVTGKTITLSWKKPRRLDPSIDPNTLMYAIQQQALGSIQWTIIVSSLKDPCYTVTSCSKGVCYAFRVLSITTKAFSKPSPSTDPVQLVNRGPYLQEGPVIIDKPDIVYVQENLSFSITITLNHVNASVIWKRSGVVLAIKPGLYEMSMPDDDQHTLKIMRVKSGDVGQLMCVASNKFGVDSCIFSVEMAAPPTFESIMEDVDVHMGETPRLAVVVEGKPIPDILWFKDATLLCESSHITFVYDDNECSLVLLNTSPEDSGVYTCTAKNLAGSVSCKAELTVRTVKEDKEDTMEDEETVLRKMRRLTDYYDIHKEIGRGAFSYVKRVTQKVGKMEYASKFISARAKRKASALREMNLLSGLHHERVLYFHDAFEKKNTFIIVTEICNEELLERLTKKSTVMESDIRSCMRQLLEGVDYLHHQNIIHLDIKPDNILMADHQGDQIRICDFGNAIELTPDEAQYCKYGTPEFVAPEIVNQTPVSKATDIWPIGVITYLCLTGVSPFAGENDHRSVLNIRNYNVAFEESMFADLCREAKGFIIKLLVTDRLRPDTEEGLRHPWFKTLTKGKPISTETLKKFVARRKWQRSLISYKSKMVMRSITELLNDSSSHISIAVPRHLKEGSPPPSSSSDSDEDIDKLPFIPMPLSMEFSGSRMSLNEIQEGTSRSNGTIDSSGSAVTHDQEAMECEHMGKLKEAGDSTGRGRARKSLTQENDKGSLDEELAELAQVSENARRPLCRGSSLELDKPEGGPRRGYLHRGGSADSALLLHIVPEDRADDEITEKGRQVLKKAVSMELPRRSVSPGPLSQDDYAHKLELMRQRLLRGGSVDKKMSGLRGPLLETLGMDDGMQYSSSLERYSRTNRLWVPPLTKAVSSDEPREDVLKPKFLRKSASFSQGDDAEPVPLHRRTGAPLEIPLAQIEERRLKEAISMSAITEPFKNDSCTVTPRKPTLKLPTPSPVPTEQETLTKLEEEDSSIDKEIKTEKSIREKTIIEPEYMASREPIPPWREYSPPVRVLTFEEQMKKDKEEAREVEEVHKEVKKVEMELKAQVKSSEMVITTSSNRVTPAPASSRAPANVVTPSPPALTVLPDGRTSVYTSIMQTIMVPLLQPLVSPLLADSTPVVVPVPAQAPFLAPTFINTPTSVPGQTKPVTLLSTPGEHPAVYSRVTSPVPKEPSPPKVSPCPTPQCELSPVGQNLHDIASEEVFEARFKKREYSPTRGLQLLNWSKPEDKPVATLDSAKLGKEVYRPGPIGAPLVFVPRRLEEKSKSVQDLREAQKDEGFMRRLSMRLKRTPSTESKEEMPKEEEPVTPRRRLSWALRGRRGSHCQERKDVEIMRMDGGIEAEAEQEDKEPEKPNKSPVMAMRRKIESTVSRIPMRIRSASEERRIASEERESNKPESKKTPLFSKLHRSTSEGRSLKSMAGSGIPQNQLASQSGTGASSESMESMFSIKSERPSKAGTEVGRRSRLDRVGLTRASKKDKMVSESRIPTAIARENDTLSSRLYTRLASDFPPVFHIKLRDYTLLEGDPITLSCLPAGSPHPHISWMKDKKPLQIDAGMNIISCPDGRQLLMIMTTTKKDAGLYECVATNLLASVSSSCILSLARLPTRPGTPEVPQRFKNTALVLWKPSDSMAPCTYSLERKAEAESNWLTVATGVADCYYNVVDLPAGGVFRFRVACVNKAGQGPFSNLSEVECLDASVPTKCSGSVVVKTVPAAPVVKTSPMTVPSLKPAPSKGLHPAPSSGPSRQTPSASASSSAAPPAKPIASTPASKPIHSKPIVPQTPTSAASAPMFISEVPSHLAVPEIQSPPPAQPAPAPAKAKTLNIKVTKPTLSQPAIITKLAPPIVLPKPQSPVNTVSPMIKTPPPLVAPPPAICKPILSVPMYAPIPAATPRVTPPFLSIPAISSPVMLISSTSTAGKSGVTHTRMTPSGCKTPLGGRPGESTLRQGVPQKPYTFMDEKARGRFGVIRECRENATGNLFMAKIVPYETDNKQTVLQEYNILKSLHHDKIMALHEAYVTPRYLVLISECCRGKELIYSLIDRFRYSEDDVVGYIVQVLQGLDYLHNRRILHLDIKPENIIITYMNMVKIIDFGSAQTFNPLFLKPFSPPVGTLEYMSPEMLKGDVVGPAADIWSVGVLTFIMLSGRLPFMENDPQETEARILAAKFDVGKLYRNVSQSASLFFKKVLCSYPWARPSIKDCYNNSWLQDAYLMRLRRQTLTFTTTRLKDYLDKQQKLRAGVATKHKLLLRSYQSSPQSSTGPIPPSPMTPVTQ